MTNRLVAALTDDSTAFRHPIANALSVAAGVNTTAIVEAITGHPWLSGLMYAASGAAYLRLRLLLAGRR